jgi:hypothetical protein
MERFLRASKRRVVGMGASLHLDIVARSSTAEQHASRFGSLGWPALAQRFSSTDICTGAAPLFVHIQQ